MKLLAAFLISALGLVITQALSHEFIFDRIENALGSEDKVFRFDTLRVTKSNRST